MAAVTGTFTATGQSASFAAPAALGGEFNISLSGTFTADVAVQRSFDAGANWFTVSLPDLTTTLDAPGSFTIKEPEPGTRYRLNCTGYTSGTVTYRLGA